MNTRTSCSCAQIFVLGKFNKPHRVFITLITSIRTASTPCWAFETSIRCTIEVIIKRINHFHAFAVFCTIYFKIKKVRINTVTFASWLIIKRILPTSAQILFFWLNEKRMSALAGKNLLLIRYFLFCYCSQSKRMTRVTSCLVTLAQLRTQMAYSIIISKRRI